MPSQPIEMRRNPSGGASPTTLRWIGVGDAPSVEDIQATTVDPDADTASEGAPEWLVTNGLGGYASVLVPNMAQLIHDKWKGREA
jgi:hypothetical protein